MPKYEARFARRARPVGGSWRVDETYIKTRSGVGYLYRGVDKAGKTVASLYQAARGRAAAMAFFRKAVALSHPRFPRLVTVDGHRATLSGLRELRRENPRWKFVEIRRCRYLNNIAEEDHRAIKMRCQSMLGFKSDRNAAISLAGIELAHQVHKRQFRFGPGNWSAWSLKKLWERALA